MKKIMFCNKHGLTQAVLEGRKTMTRRIFPKDWSDGYANLTMTLFEKSVIAKYSRYKIGEVVAISQPYETFMSDHELCVRGLLTSAAAHNSMFVEAKYMPHHIRITDIKVELLQDISDEDCLKEGIFQWGDPFREDRVEDYGFVGATRHYLTPREAFAALIDKVSDKGTWEKNPWVFAYSFELID